MTAVLLRKAPENLWIPERRKFQVAPGFLNSNRPRRGCIKKRKTPLTLFSIFLELGATRSQVMLRFILVTNQAKYESLSKEDLKNIMPFNPCANTKLAPLITEKSILTIELIALFCKEIPGFNNLCVEDQSLLLKVYHNEVILLRAARKFDRETGTIFFANNGPFTRQNFNNDSMSHFGMTLFNFCEDMWSLQIEDDEYALLTTIIIFSNSPSLLQPQEVLKIQSFYLNVLKVYTDINRPDCDRFSKLLKTLPKLRTLSNMFRSLYYSFQVDAKTLPSYLIASTSSSKTN